MIRRTFHWLPLLSLMAIEAYADSPFSYRGILELQLSHADSLPSWLNDNSGKFRFAEEDNDRINIGTTGIDWQYQLTHTAQFKGSVIYNADPDHELSFTELYWRYRPIPNSQWRADYRVGSFYAPLSLENRGPLWTSSYNISPSVINSWIGEELRTLGVQGRWTLQGKHRGSPNDFTITSALFAANDTTGALLAWRGWVKSDRQTGIGQSLPLQSLPTFNEGNVFDQQHQETYPFREIDHRLGFYVGTEWKHRKKLRLSLLYYDNQADSTVIKDGQYAWSTHFTHASAHWSLANQWEILAQYINGATAMGVDNAVDAPFEAGYVMLAKTFHRQRVSLQWETFSVDDEDNTVMDSNQEQGNSINIAWLFQRNKHWRLAAQLTRIHSDRKQRVYFSEDPSINETQLVGSVRYQW